MSLDEDVCKECFRKESQWYFPREEWYHRYINCPFGARPEALGPICIDDEPPLDCPFRLKHEEDSDEDEN